MSIIIKSIEKGKAHPLGSTPDKSGVNFSIFSRNATAVELLLFENHDDIEPTHIIPLDPVINKTFSFWHVYIKGINPGIHYAYRIDGPNDTSKGHRFNKNKVLIDPYAKGNTNTLWKRENACGKLDNIATSMRSVVIDTNNYNWEGDEPLRRSMDETIIYEIHVKGFTKADTNQNNQGTYKGIIEKIPYLKDLGVTAIELLPVFEFDDTEVLRTSVDGTNLYNYWGYSTISYFAPHSAYCSSPDLGEHINEFRDMVKALHKEGIEVILDVVFNHTNEGNHLGPYINFRGIDNSIYYHLVKDNKTYYMDYSGCGNTLNCNHPIVEKMILDSLEFWVNEMHIDGFRFDEGSIMSRGEDGTPMLYPPVVWHIELSEVLADTKIIAEAWDAAGLYQIGYFPGYRWAEWNGLFRDNIRSFIKGESGKVNVVASRIAGSADLYQKSEHLPINSINFITCHDGFTMYDLVSYNEKHNEANGEGNLDGINDNLSCNYGMEGDTEHLEINCLRKKQIKNFAAILLLSQGVPMILAGDEIMRTQHGNNNAYCQDNQISWIDWSLLEKNYDIFRFFKWMIAFRKRHPTLHRRRFFTGEVNDRGLKDIEWHGCQLYSPGWEDSNSKVLSFTLGSTEDKEDIHVMMNMDLIDLDFELPDSKGRDWYRAIDTSLQSPDDIKGPGEEIIYKDNVYHMQSRSIVVLISR